MELNGYYINIHKEYGESGKSYLYRLYFIGSNIYNFVNNIEELINKSIIYRSIKYLNCKYDKNVHDEITILSKRINI